MGRPPYPYQLKHSGRGPYERRLQGIRILELRNHGWPVRLIAPARAISKRTVYRRIADALARTPLRAQSWD